MCSLGSIPFHPFVLISRKGGINSRIKTLRLRSGRHEAGGHFPAKLGDGRFPRVPGRSEDLTLRNASTGPRTLPYPGFPTGNVQGRPANCPYITVTLRSLTGKTAGNHFWDVKKCENEGGHTIIGRGCGYGVIINKNQRPWQRPVRTETTLAAWLCCMPPAA